MKYSILGIFGLFLIFSSCKKDNNLTQSEVDQNERIALQDYADANNLTLDSLSSGLYYVISEAGIGDKPINNNVVEVHYKGYFLDGEVFDSSDGGAPIKGQLSGFIPGWIQGIPLFAKNGRGILLVPSRLAYGRNGRGDIPGDTPLIFDIELIDFEF